MTIALRVTNQKPSKQVLRFTPFAWAKLVYLRDIGTTEVGAFGISALADLLLVEDLYLVRQKTTVVSVSFEDEAVADFIDARVDEGRSVEQVGRIWIHSHPGDSAAPSRTDEETFDRCFGACSWAIMFILAKGGQTYARARFNAGPGCQVELPVEIDFCVAFSGSRQAAWAQEYERCVQPLLSPTAQLAHSSWPELHDLAKDRLDDDWYWGDEADWEGLWTPSEEVSNAFYH